MSNLRLAVRVAALPLLVLALSVGFMSLYRTLGLPSSEEIVRLADSYMVRYGYLIVFLGAALEATPAVNFYLPGSTVVILGVAFCRRGTLNVFGVLAVATVAFLLAYAIDYAIGRYGWLGLIRRLGFERALERTRESIADRGEGWLWVGYVHPNTGALAATSCGILQIPLRRFVITSMAAVTCWNVVWGAIVYHFAGLVLRFTDMRWLVPLVVVWAIYAIIAGMHSGRGRS